MEQAETQTGSAEKASSSVHQILYKINAKPLYNPLNKIGNFHADM
jgi:hypothetical protein